MLLQEQSGVENKKGFFALTMLITLPIRLPLPFALVDFSIDLPSES
jgi:hypothetical protein